MLNQHGAFSDSLKNCFACFFVPHLIIRSIQFLTSGLEYATEVPLKLRWHIELQCFMIDLIVIISIATLSISKLKPR